MHGLAEQRPAGEGEQHLNDYREEMLRQYLPETDEEEGSNEADQ